MSNLPFQLAAFIFGFVFVYWLVPTRLRKPLILISSLGMLAWASPIYAILLVIQVALTFSAGRAILLSEDGKGKIIFTLILVWLAGCLLALKIDIGQDWKAQTVTAFGISYITFRLVHFVVAAYRKEIKAESPSDFLDLLNHVLFFPSLIAGPVLKYEAWIAQKPEDAKLTLQIVNLGLFRILLGVVKKFLISDQLNLNFIAPVFSAPTQYSGPLVASAICGDYFRIYMDFSGYSDIAIGTALLFGYRLPENFNFPFLKPNIAEFWRNWHITLHDFIRDHFFIPFFAFRSSQMKIYLGLLSTMLLLMLWHAFSWGFLILGMSSHRIL